MAAEPPRLVCLSLGAGVQSTTLALLAVEGRLPGLQHAIFADTGWEPAAVYAHLDRLQPVLEAAGIAVDRIVGRWGNLRERCLSADRIPIPVYVATRSGEGAPSSRECTRDAKVRPITRHLRGLLGMPGRVRIPHGTVEQWIGFSVDEVQRATSRSDAPWIHPRYPLLELGWTRKDCLRFLAARGWTVAKSACIGCPFHGNAQWRDLRDNHPDEWADAVAFDHALRARAPAGRLRGQPYLHRSLLPLEAAPIDRVTSREWADRQTELADELGDPDGCSPYGCRSGG